MILHQKLRHFHLKTKALPKLRALAERRHEPIEMSKVEKQRAKAPVSTEEVEICLKHMIEVFDAQIPKFEKVMMLAVGSDQTVAQIFEFLLTLEGVGRPTAFKLLAYFLEIGLLKNKEAVAIAGLVPRARDSGQFKGYRSTGRGRQQLRSVTFMATLATIRSKGIYREYFERETQNSGVQMKALISTAAKLITVITAKIRDIPIDNNLQLSR